MKTTRDFMNECLTAYYDELERWDIPLYLDHIALSMVVMSYDYIERGCY